MVRGEIRGSSLDQAGFCALFRFNGCRNLRRVGGAHRLEKALNKGVSAILRLMSALQQPASLYCQIIQCHLQLRNCRTNFWVLSDLFLHGF